MHPQFYNYNLKESEAPGSEAKGLALMVLRLERCSAMHYLEIELVCHSAQQALFRGES